MLRSSQFSLKSQPSLEHSSRISPSVQRNSPTVSQASNSEDDVQAVAGDVLRHRLICSFEADAQGLTSDFLIDQLLQQVPVP